MSYRGRFAPTPTGPLHFGSLLAAVVSYVDARAHHGVWNIRIEDIDPPREMSGARDQILKCLGAHALHPDDPISFQSDHTERFEKALATLKSKNLVYHCPCSRKDLQSNGGQHLPMCQSGNLGDRPFAVKFKRPSSSTYTWTDQFQGTCQLSVGSDFVLKRKDGLYAYQLAVVADDIAQEVTHVIRGIDLLDSTPIQIALYRALNAPAPNFGHFPVLVNSNGQKLSKQNHSPAIDLGNATGNLRLVCERLGAKLSENAHSCQDILDELIAQWHRLESLKQTQLIAPSRYRD